MRAAALVAFVAGIFLLQQQSELPSAPVLWAVAASAAALAGAAIGLALRPAFRAQRTAVVALAAASAALVGFGYAALLAQHRLADELAFADEGRDVRVTGVIASLPAQLERGTRFEFAIEGAEPADVHVPARIALSWYAPDVRVRPAERWAFTVRLRRPHGALNPGGFDVEGWMLERNLRATGYVRDGRGDEAPRRLDARVGRPGPMVDRARDALREALQRRLQGERYAGVLVALVLGDQRAIDDGDGHSSR